MYRYALILSLPAFVTITVHKYNISDLESIFSIFSTRQIFQREFLHEYIRIIIWIMISLAIAMVKWEMNKVKVGIYYDDHDINNTGGPLLGMYLKTKTLYIFYCSFICLLSNYLEKRDIHSVYTNTNYANFKISHFNRRQRIRRFCIPTL